MRSRATLAAFMLGVLAAGCVSAPATHIDERSAVLNGGGRCTESSCTSFFTYWRADQTEADALTTREMPWSGVPTDVQLSVLEQVSGLLPNTEYRYRFCGRPAPAAAVACSENVASFRSLPAGSRYEIVNDGLAEVWSGTAPHTALVTDQGMQYIGFWNKNRKLTVAGRALPHGPWTLQELATTYDGWNTHDGIHMAVDRSGHLHVIANDQRTPLAGRYYRMASKGDVASLAPPSERNGYMVDARTGPSGTETHQTYSDLFKNPAGDLFALMSDGEPGSVWGSDRVLNRYDPTTRLWSRVACGEGVPQADCRLFRGIVPEQDRRNVAYPKLRVDARGVFHMTWSWRNPNGLPNTFGVGYAKSVDNGRSWRTVDDRAVSLPIEVSYPLDPADPRLVSSLGKESGLTNPRVELGFDVDGVTPSYHRYNDAQTRSQIVNARPIGTGSGTGAWRNGTTEYGCLRVLAANVALGAVLANTEGRLVQRAGIESSGCPTTPDVTSAVWRYLDANLVPLVSPLPPPATLPQLPNPRRPPLPTPPLCGVTDPSRDQSYWTFRGTGSDPEAEQYYLQYVALPSLNFRARYVHPDGSERLVDDQRNPPEGAIECDPPPSVLRVYKYTPG
jgi:hypothetical protein